MLDRPLALPLRDPKGRRSVLLKGGVVLGAILLVIGLLSHVNLSRSLRRLDTGLASGSTEGNYHAIADAIAKRAALAGGKVRNVESSGSGDNLARLARAASGGCDVGFALVQDGSDWKLGPKSLRLVGRLPKAESVFILGKDADKLTELSQLAGLRMGIGLEGSGSARAMTQLLSLPEIAPLGVKTSYHPNVEQIEALKRGDIDLAAFVIDEDAPFIVDAVRNQGLQIAGFSHIDVIARRMPHFRTGRIGAGQFDAVKVLPAQDKRVLRVDTLLITNGCEGRAEIIELLTVVREEFPDFVRHNKETPNTTGLELADAAKGFLEHDGPELADEYVPWLVDVMPPANWAYIVMGVSLLFNAMSIGHRFRLWRIDDARVKLENELGAMFGQSVTLGDIERAKPKSHDDGQINTVTSLIARFEALASRSRRHSLSVLVPMGQEMAYRYQEEIIYQTLAVLRGYLSRLEVAST